MKKLLPLTLLILSGTAFAESHQSIESCAKLLPNDGKQYEFSLTGIITGVQKFKGELEISDKTKKPLTDEEKKKTEPFVECVKKLIK